jgi:hypothetical protein
MRSHKQMRETRFRIFRKFLFHPDLVFLKLKRNTNGQPVSRNRVDNNTELKTLRQDTERGFSMRFPPNLPQISAAPARSFPFAVF